MHPCVAKASCNQDYAHVGYIGTYLNIGTGPGPLDSTLNFKGNTQGCWNVASRGGADNAEKGISS